MISTLNRFAEPSAFLSLGLAPQGQKPGNPHVNPSNGLQDRRSRLGAWSSVHLASKTDHLLEYFQRLGRLSERPMRIEPMAEAWEAVRQIMRLGE